MDRIINIEDLQCVYTLQMFPANLLTYDVCRSSYLFQPAFLSKSMYLGFVIAFVARYQNNQVLTG